MASTLEGKRILITGAGGGIGRASARHVAARGAAVLCTDVDADGLAQTLAILKQENPGILAAAEVLDSSDFDAARALVERTADAWGGNFDALLNVAGVILAKPLEDSELSDLERIFRVNVGGVLVMSRAILPRLGSGAVIVNVSSTSGRDITPGLGVYGASKAANIYLTRAWARELCERGIRVCGVGPGAVDTAMPRRTMPPGEEGERVLAEAVAHAALIPRMAQPEEIANAIGYLLSDEASYITGSTLWIDGGAPS